MEFLARRDEPSEAEHVIVFRWVSHALRMAGCQYMRANTSWDPTVSLLFGEAGTAKPAMNPRYVAGGASFQMSATQRHCPSVQAEFAHMR